MPARQVLLLSSSKVHSHGYLEYAIEDINTLFRKNNVSTILFVPYALSNYDGYLELVQEVFIKLGYKIESIHKGDPVEAAEKAEAFFIGGGNTFQLLKALYDNNVLEVIRKRVLIDGVPYLGSSAGTNVATKSIHTTNDMPIVYPPSFSALELVPFNINPHYQDPDPTSTHKGETREERILQFQEIPGAGPVLGLREGCSLLIDGDKILLKGICKSRLFIRGQEPKEIDVGSDLSFLLHDKP